jgi:hypothetical protein
MQGQHMTKRSSRTPRPFEIVMDESAEERFPWDLDDHLNGCLSGYETAASYGAAVFFALEALSGIARDVDTRAQAGEFDRNELDKDWIVSPRTTFGVPWIWIWSLAAAFEKYKSEGGPLGQTFGLEGGQGKAPIIHKLMQILDERAIARWIWSRIQVARTAGEEIRIEDAVQDAAVKFGKSDVTIRRTWQRFHQPEQKRTQE